MRAILENFKGGHFLSWEPGTGLSYNFTPPSRIMLAYRIAVHEYRFWTKVSDAVFDLECSGMFWSPILHIHLNSLPQCRRTTLRWLGYLEWYRHHYPCSGSLHILCYQLHPYSHCALFHGYISLTQEHKVPIQPHSSDVSLIVSHSWNNTLKV